MDNISITKITAFIQALLNLLKNLLKTVNVGGDKEYDMIGAIGNEVVEFGEGVDELNKDE